MEFDLVQLRSQFSHFIYRIFGLWNMLFFFFKVVLVKAWAIIAASQQQRYKDINFKTSSSAWKNPRYITICRQMSQTCITALLRKGGKNLTCPAVCVSSRSSLWLQQSHLTWGVEMLLCVYAFHQVVGHHSVNNAVLAQKNPASSHTRKKWKMWGEKSEVMW